MGEQEAKFSEWVVLELMGHRKLAGLLTEQEIAGHGFLRLEVPGAPEEPPWHKLREDELADGHECGYYCRKARPAVAPTTQFYAPSAVYAITPTTEDVARRMMAGLRYEPVSRYEVPALPAAEEPEFEEAVS